MSIALVYFAAFVVYWAVDYYAGKRRQVLSFIRACSPPQIASTDIVTVGRDLDMADPELHSMLAKRFHYYQWLNESSKAIF